MVTSPRTEDRLAEIGERLRRGEAVHTELPHGGRLSVDLPLPYLLVYRAPPQGANEVTERLVRSEANYLVWRGGPDEAGALSRLVWTLVETGSARAGAFLLLELWAAPKGSTAFRILCPEREARTVVETLAGELAELRGLHREIRVEVEPTEDRRPPGAPPLLTIAECYELGCLLLGVEVPTVYLQPDEAARPYPVFFRRFKERFVAALRKAIFTFIASQTSARIESYRGLGARTVHESVWPADRALAEIAGSFDFLLLVSPTDEHQAWEEFRASGFERAPDFHYRLLPEDPDLLKRRLYDIALEEVEDPALHFVLRDKREDLDRRISMLIERGSRSFLYSSIRLYHPVDDDLLRMAEEILATIAPAPPGAGPLVDAGEFRARALEEFAYYRARYPGFSPEAQLRPDISGLMVSRGNLLIDQQILLDPARVEALLHHEVGTHILTYVNGAAQPLRQLASGLAGYDELQEGLGILGEQLAGGLTPNRMRVLAARVVVARAVEGGAEFVEVFRRLTGDYGFSPGSAFDITQRAFHGGGFTRDLIYLRGFVRLLEYLRRGGELRPIFVGKIAQRHIPVVRELSERGILREPLLLPRYLEDEDAARRLEAIRLGLPLTRLVEGGSG